MSNLGKLLLVVCALFVAQISMAESPLLATGPSQVTTSVDYYGNLAVVMSGPSAQKLYDSLTVPEKGGLGFEGLSNTLKFGTGVVCGKSVRSPFIPGSGPQNATSIIYSCTFLLDYQGNVLPPRQ